MISNQLNKESTNPNVATSLSEYELLLKSYNEFKEDPKISNEAMKESLLLTVKPLPLEHGMSSKKNILELWALSKEMVKNTQTTHVDETSLERFLSEKCGVSLNSLRLHSNQLKRYDIDSYGVLEPTAVQPVEFKSVNDKIYEMQNINKRKEGTNFSNEILFKNLGAKIGKTLKPATVLTEKNILIETLKKEKENEINMNSLKYSAPISKSILLSNMYKELNLEKVLNCFKPFLFYKAKNLFQLYSMTLMTKENLSENEKKSLLLKELLMEFRDMFNSESDLDRRNLFSLLLQQVTNPNNIYSLELNDSNELVRRTLSYYENDYFMNLIEKNKLVGGGIPTSFEDKYKMISNHTDGVIYSQFEEAVYKYNKKEENRKWGNVFYFLRCGLFSDLNALNNKLNSSDINDFIAHLEKKKSIKHIFDQNLQKSELIHENPFKHACYVLASKINMFVNPKIFINTSDRIWFYISTIDETFNSPSRSSTNKPLYLVNVQQFIRSSQFSNGVDSDLQYCLYLISAGLYEDCIMHLSTIKEYTLDSIVIGIIILEINELNKGKLLNDFKESQNINENVTFVHQILNNAFISLIEKHNKDKTIELIFLYYIFKGKLSKSDIVNNIICKYKHYNYLENPNSVNTTLNTQTLRLTDIFNESDLRDMVQECIYISLRDDNKEYFNSLLNLAKNYGFIDRFLEMMISDSIMFLNSRIPEHLFDDRIHQKTNKVYKEASLKERQSKLVNDISNQIANYDYTFKLNFKMLRQLEVVDEIYQTIANNDIYRAFNIIITHLNIIPFKNDSQVKEYIQNVFNLLFKEFMHIIPDICYLCVYVFDAILNNESQSFMNRYDDSPFKNNINSVKDYMRTLSNFIEEIDKMNIVDSQRISALRKQIISCLNKY